MSRYVVDVLLRSGVSYKVGPAEAESPNDAIIQVATLIDKRSMLSLTSGGTVSIMPPAVDALYCGGPA